MKIDQKTEKSWVVGGIEFADTPQGRNTAQNKLMANGFTSLEASQYLNVLEEDFKKKSQPPRQKYPWER